MNPEPFNDEIAIGKGWSTFTRNKEYDYIQATVVTPRGMVFVYAQGNSKERPLSKLSFAYKGRFYSRTWQHRYSDRGLVTLAKRYAEEIAA